MVNGSFLFCVTLVLPVWRYGHDCYRRLNHYAKSDFQTSRLVFLKKNSSRGHYMINENRFGFGRGLYWAAALIGCLFLATVALVVHMATLEANRFSLKSETTMARLEIDRLVEDFIHDQQEISYWDDAVDALVKRDQPSVGFAEENIAGWLVSDFDFSEVVFVDLANKITLASLGDQVTTSVKSLPLVDASRDMIETAREKFLESAIKTRRGYFVRPPAGALVPPIQAVAFRLVNDVPHLIVSQVIIPEEMRRALKDDEITVMLSSRVVSESMLKNVGKRLDLIAPSIRWAGQNPAGSSIALPNNGAAGPLNFNWQPRDPRSEILANVAPFALGLSLSLCLLLGFIVTRHFKTLSALSASEIENRFLANHDSMTKLANRQYFDQALDDAFERLRTREFAVLCVDLDKFKTVNDTHGHQAGDAVLMEVAERFRDRVGDKGLVARIGGDEFVALIHTYENRDEVKWLAESMIEDACLPVFFGGSQLQISASVGIAFAPKDGRDSRQLYNAADRALYNSKEQGRGRVSDFAELCARARKTA